MNNHKDIIKTENIFEHNKLFHAYKNLLYLGNNKCYIDNTLNNELTLFLETNNKSIEKIIYFSLLLKSRLRQKLLSNIFKTINEIDYELNKDNLTKELKDKLEIEKKSILNIFIEEINETIELINEHTLFISSEIENLNSQFIIEKIASFIQKQEALINTLSDDMIKQVSQSEKTKKDLNTIRESENILHKRNFFELFKNVLPSKDEVNHLNIEKQEKDVLTSLIDLLNTLFSSLNYGFSYTKIVETRHQLTDLYLKQMKELTQLKNKHQNAIFVLTYYHAITDIDYFLKIFIEQLIYLNQYWKGVNLELSLLKENSQLAEEIIKPIFAFLNDFSLYFNQIKNI